MSSTVTETGKLRKVELNGISVEDYCRNYAVNVLGEEDVLESYDSYVEFVISEGEGEFVILNGDIYDVLEYKWSPENDSIFNASKQKDGTIQFMLQYYNGGCGFQEALECAMKHLKESK